MADLCALSYEANSAAETRRCECRFFLQLLLAVTTAARNEAFKKAGLASA